MTDVEGSSVHRLVVSSLTEGHRLASERFMEAQLDGRRFRDILRAAFGIVSIKKDVSYFITPDNWWSIYRTVFRYDPNSLVHGLLFAREHIKISRILTAHLEAFGAARVSSSGVKFDRLPTPKSVQPIFSKDEETAQRIQATFLLDLGLLRSYGHDDQGLSAAQKNLLLQLALWKIERMLASPFRFRSGCHLRAIGATYATEDTLKGETIPPANLKSEISKAIAACEFDTRSVTDVYYPSKTLFNAQNANVGDDATDEADMDDVDDASDEEDQS